MMRTGREAISIRPCDARHSRKRDGTGCEMQEMSSVAKFHDALGVVACAQRRLISDDERRQHFTANRNDRNFGLSRWQLSVNATRNCCSA